MEKEGEIHSSLMNMWLTEIPLMETEKLENICERSQYPNGRIFHPRLISIVSSELETRRANTGVIEPQPARSEIPEPEIPQHETADKAPESDDKIFKKKALLIGGAVLVGVGIAVGWHVTRKRRHRW